MAVKRNKILINATISLHLLLVTFLVAETKYRPRQLNRAEVYFGSILAQVVAWWKNSAEERCTSLTTRKLPVKGRANRRPSQATPTVTSCPAS